VSERSHAVGSITGGEPRGRLSAPVSWRHRRTPATPTRLTTQDIYAFWIAGLFLLGVIAVRAMRQPPPQLRLPRPTGAQLSTVLAWLIIAGVVLVVLLTRSK